MKFRQTTVLFIFQIHQNRFLQEYSPGFDWRADLAIKGISCRRVLRECVHICTCERITSRFVCACEKTDCQKSRILRFPSRAGQPKESCSDIPVSLQIISQISNRYLAWRSTTRAVFFWRGHASERSTAQVTVWLSNLRSALPVETKAESGQKSRMERLKANVEPLLTYMRVDTVFFQTGLENESRTPLMKVVGVAPDTTHESSSLPSRM